LFCYLLTLIDFNLIQGLRLDDFALKYFFISFFLIPFVIFIKSYRWLILLNLFSINLSKSSSFLIYSGSLFYSVISPGGILGELTKVLHLKNDKKIKLIETTSSVIFDRIFDLSIILIIGIFSITFYKYEHLLFSVSITLLMIFLVYKITSSQLFCKNILKINLNIKGFQLHDFILFMNSFFVTLTFKKIYRCIVLTFFSQIIAIIQLHYICQILQLDFSILFIFVINSLSVLISLLPISIAGIGNRDALLIYIFYLEGIAKEYAVIFSTLYLLTFYFGTIFFSFLSLMVKPLKLK